MPRYTTKQNSPSLGGGWGEAPYGGNQRNIRNKLSDFLLYMHHKNVAKVRPADEKLMPSANTNYHEFVMNFRKIFVSAAMNNLR